MKNVLFHSANWAELNSSASGYSKTGAVAVIMAGGSGTRFWPLSRSDKPKQFLNLGSDDHSLIQEAAARLDVLCEQRILVVTAENQTHLVREHLPGAAVLAEPVARNTAACLGYAAVQVLNLLGDVPLVCVPADPLIIGQEALVNILRSGVELAAKEDLLITIGVRPDFPETGYGYIECGLKHLNSVAFQVKRFVEKPNRETAQSYLDSGRYFWNSGMFIWRPSVILAAIREYLPDLMSGLEKISLLLKDLPGEDSAHAERFLEVKEIYQALQSVSIDYGIMEKAQNVVMLAGEGFSWSDIGSWRTWAEIQLERAKAKNAAANFTQGDVMLLDSSDCAVISACNNGKLIAGVGLKDLVIVETKDALLVCSRDRAQDVKKVVDELRLKQRSDLL